MSLIRRLAILLVFAIRSANAAHTPATVKAAGLQSFRDSLLGKKPLIRRAKTHTHTQGSQQSEEIEKEVQMEVDSTGIAFGAKVRNNDDGKNKHLIRREHKANKRQDATGTEKTVQVEIESAGIVPDALMAIAASDVAKQQGAVSVEEKILRLEAENQRLASLHRQDQELIKARRIREVKMEKLMKVDCTAKPKGKFSDIGCAGAKNEDGKFSKRFCTNKGKKTEGVQMWYGACCKWKGKKTGCVEAVAKDPPLLKEHDTYDTYFCDGSPKPWENATVSEVKKHFEADCTSKGYTDGLCSALATQVFELPQHELWSPDHLGSEVYAAVCREIDDLTQTDVDHKSALAARQQATTVGNMLLDKAVSHKGPDTRRREPRQRNEGFAFPWR